MNLRFNIVAAYIVLMLSAVLFVFNVLSLTDSTDARLTYYSDEFEPDFSMYHIGVTLSENGKPKAWRNYQQAGGSGDQSDGAWHVNGNTSLIEDIKNVKPETEYDEVLTVSNSGTIDEYVRVVVYKYWVDDGKKSTELDPGFIILNFVNLDEEHWIVDKSLSTEERVVLYYAYPLSKSDGINLGETSVPFADKLRISSKVRLFVTQEKEVDEKTNYTKITNHYLYDGKEFCIDVEVDGVQTHNAADAIRSSWGCKVSIDDATGKLTWEGE